MKKVFPPLVWLFFTGVFMVNPVLSLETGQDIPAVSSSEEKSTEDRVQLLEDAMARKKNGATAWDERIKICGTVDVEAGFSNVDRNDPAAEDQKSGDVDLAAVEVAIGMAVNPQVDAYVLLKYEDDAVFLDEGFITWNGPKGCPASLTAGRVYIPFGSFESYFISDPLTLELGETNEGAVVMDCRLCDERIVVALGFFNGKTEKQDKDDLVSNYVARIAVSPMEGLSFGGSYTSNLASADAFSEQVQGDLSEYVAGWSAFVSVTLMDRLTVNCEYLSSVNEFSAGEIYDAADNVERYPEAWNIELGYAFMDNLNGALRYGGSKDGDAGHGEFLAETQFGVVMNWDTLDKTRLSLEYMNGSYSGNYRTVDTVTAQLSVEF